MPENFTVVEVKEYHGSAKCQRCGNHTATKELISDKGSSLFVCDACSYTFL